MVDGVAGSSLSVTVTKTTSVTISQTIAFLWRLWWTGDATAKVAPIKVRTVEERILTGVRGFSILKSRVDLKCELIFRELAHFLREVLYSAGGNQSREGFEDRSR